MKFLFDVILEKHISVPKPTQAPTPEPTQAPTPEPTQAPTPKPTGFYFPLS